VLYSSFESYLLIPLTDEAEPDDASLYVNIFPMMLAGGEFRDRLMCLSSQFHLFQSCRRIIDGSLSEIDAVLEFGLALFKPSQLEHFQVHLPSKKEQLCLTMFHGINWYGDFGYSFFP